MSEPAKQRRKPGPKPKPNVTLTKPIGKPVLLDRQACSGCHKLRPVATVDGEPVVADHLIFARDETHPRGGEHATCPGSGKPGEGRIIHNAVMEPRS